MDDPAAVTMAANLETKTGRSLDSWVELVRAEGIEKHGQIISYLKAEHGLTHGYANFVATQARYQPTTSEDLVAQQYRGAKAGLRTIYEAALALVEQLGPDVEVAPKKTYVCLRRRKQFALLKPATSTRLEVGLNLGERPGTDRLLPTSGMCSHLVRLTSEDEVDDELRGWLAAAYERAG